MFVVNMLAQRNFDLSINIPHLSNLCSEFGRPAAARPLRLDTDEPEFVSFWVFTWVGCCLKMIPE